jgi:hypothetical protein
VKHRHLQAAKPKWEKLMQQWRSGAAQRQAA